MLLEVQRVQGANSWKTAHLIKTTLQDTVQPLATTSTHKQSLSVKTTPSVPP